jgi:DNA-binding MarR family transcriptional regulator/N-acetylglutamate synthase-like GNAT family acetyltransferase
MATKLTQAPPEGFEERIAAVRAFNRFYTNVTGVLREGLLRTPYSLSEARVLFELGQGDVGDAAGLGEMLDLDAGYLSRMLARFERDGLLVRKRSAADGRRQEIRLSAKGRRAVETLDGRSAKQVGDLLERLGEDEQRRLVGAMSAIRRILEGGVRESAFVLRPPRPGDLGWIVQRHGALYAEEYGWNESFEALVAEVVAEFAQRRDPQPESAWIAEVDGEPAGCVLCTRKQETVAQLRLLLVEPSARGIGIGSRLVEECVRFARRAGYERIVLWTNDVLRSARPIYEAAGFRLVGEKAHTMFGPEVVGQDWELDLSRPASNA